jgi:hypothetical protein
MTTERRITLPPEYDDLYAGVALFDSKAGAVLYATGLRHRKQDASTCHTQPRVSATGVSQRYLQSGND